MNLTDPQSRLLKRVLNAIETGAPDGKYGTLVVMADGPNNIRQITYGRSQTTEFAGLRELLERYVEAQGQFAEALKPFIPRVRRELLCDDEQFKSLLRRAGNDPTMRRVQDEFFDERYFWPAMQWADERGFTTPLSALVIYDSFIHSGGILEFLRARFAEVPPHKGGDEKAWVRAYLKARHQWLTTHSNVLLRRSAYRTQCLLEQAQRNNWDLSQLPIIVNGIAVSA